MAKNVDAAEKTVSLLDADNRSAGTRGCRSGANSKDCRRSHERDYDIVKLLNSGKRGRVGNGR
jgi:hypothetical protein